MSRVVAEELLQIFYRVALHARAQRLAHHGVQIDEALGAQQHVEFVLAGGVAAHQAFQGGGLVGAKW